MVNNHFPNLFRAPRWVNDLLFLLSSAPNRSITSVIRESAPCDADQLNTDIRTRSTRGEADPTLSIQLYHACVPALVEVDFIEFDGHRVQKTQHFGWDTDLLDTLLDLNSRRIDGIIECVASRKTRHCLGLLEHDSALNSLDDLCECCPNDVLDQERLALHHYILPKLNREGLLAYDPYTGSIQYFGDPLVDRLLNEIADLSECDA